MDQIDRNILDVIQSEFPIDPRPYAVLGDKLGLSEDQVLERVKKLKKDGVIRRMGANFGSNGLGWQSTLCAACVSDDKMDSFVAEVNKYPGVTHNYLRKHHFNVWFTFIAPDMETIETYLAEITDKTGIEIMNLPADKLFKIKVDFNMKKES